MKIVIETETPKELESAAARYKSINVLLGRRFTTQIRKILRQIISYPYSAPQIDGSLRRCWVQQFPFGLIYPVENDLIRVFVVMELHRDPNYWRDRIK